MKTPQQREKAILWISFSAGLLFALVELFFSILSHSQSAFMDGIYDASELIWIALTLFLTPLFYRPISEQHPYGFYQVESIFLLVKGVMMFSVTITGFIQLAESFLQGGIPVNSSEVSLFQFILGLFSLLLLGVMKKLGQGLSSPTIQMELLGWKLDVLYSLGLSLGFFVAALLENTSLSPFTPYVDPVAALMIILFVVPDILQILCQAGRDLFLFSPRPDQMEHIKTICNQALQAGPLTPVFYDITKTGRYLWIAVYFQSQEDLISLSDLQRMRSHLQSQLDCHFSPCTCELILAPSSSNA